MKHVPGAGRRPGARSGAILALLSLSLATGCNCDPTPPGVEGDAGFLVPGPDGGQPDAGQPDGGSTGDAPDGGGEGSHPDAGPLLTYTLGGTVSGLTGSGLTLREVRNGLDLTPGNGPFTFPGGLLDGASYEVRVTHQPTAPPQLCTVAGATGTVAGAAVTTVMVSCGPVPANGALDPTFGGGGWTYQGRASGKAVAVQADGKLVVAGGTQLSRYLPDGTPDATFGTGGTVSLLTQVSGVDGLEAVALQPDGRIVVAGHLNATGGDDWLLVRCLTDGSLDPSFGTGGKVQTDFAGSSDRAYEVRVQPDGKLVAAGFATYGTLVQPDSDFAAARYLADGTLDSTFGAGGKAHANLAGRVDLGAGAVVQADGKVVVVGRASVDGGSDPDFGAVRFDAAGVLDPTFGTGGVLRLDLAGTWDEATGVLLQPDGKLVLCGFARIGSVYHFALVRLDDRGLRDPGFGTGGVATAPLTASTDYARAVALQADGKLVVAGQAAALTVPDFGVARFTAAGVLDTTFGTGGVVTVDFYAGADGASDLAVQADGRLVVVGAARNGGTPGLGMARVMP